MHLMPRERHREHDGLASSHFCLRSRHFWHPPLDRFLEGFRTVELGVLFSDEAEHFESNEHFELGEHPESGDPFEFMGSSHTSELDESGCNSSPPECSDFMVGDR